MISTLSFITLYISSFPLNEFLLILILVLKGYLITFVDSSNSPPSSTLIRVSYFKYIEDNFILLIDELLIDPENNEKYHVYSLIYL